MSLTRTDIQTKALAELLPYKSGSVDISMRVGKTLFALKWLNQRYDLTMKILIVIPKNAIKNGWEKDFEKYKFGYLQHKVSYVTYRSLTKESISAYTHVILDECHSVVVNTHEGWLTSFEGAILGLTGTYPKVGFSKFELLQEACPLRFIYGTDEAVSDGVINNYKIIVRRLALSNVKNIEKKRKDGKPFKVSELDQYNYISKIVDKEYAEQGALSQRTSIFRSNTLKNFETKLTYLKGLLPKITKKTIVFTNTTQQADELSDISYHSKNPDSKENLESFIKGDSHILTAVDQLSEGVTVPELTQGFIMHSYASPTKTPQRLGRMLNLNPEATSTIHILCYKDTIDERWVSQALSKFDVSKIKYLDV